MSSKLQNIQDIGPVGEGSGKKKANDPVTKDYEEGKRLLDNGNPSQAAMAFHNALLGYEEKGDKTGIANACNQLGHVCLAKEDYAGAENHYKRAYALCVEFDDPMSLFSLNKRFIEVYRGLKRWDEAVNSCLDVLDVYQTNNDPRGAVSVLETLAEIYVEAKMNEKAADTYRTVAAIHRNFKHETSASEFEQKAQELAKKA